MQQMAHQPVSPTKSRGRFNWRVPAWAMFESGDSAFSLIIVSTGFGEFVETTLHHPGAHVTLAVAIASLFIAVLAPALGAASDLSGPRKPYMAFFVSMAVLMTALMGQLRDYSWVLAVFIVAYVCVNGGFNFFLSMLPANTTPEKVSSTVSLAVAVGYMGGLACLIGFGLFLPAGHPEAVFLPMAGMYLLFALPCLLFARDFPRKPKAPRLDLRQAYRNVFTTFKEARQHKDLFRFLIADFLYENAVASVIVLIGLYSRNVMGFTAGEVSALFGPALIIAIATSFAFGWLTKKIGPKRAVLVDMGIWLALFVSAMLITDKTLFTWVCAPLAGMGLAGVWSASRVLFTALTPANKSGQFWGLYNLSGRSASVIGDLTVTVVLILIGESPLGYKAALVALAVYIVLGALTIMRLPDARPSDANVLPTHG